MRAALLALGAALLVASPARGQGPGLQERLVEIVEEERAKSETPAILIAVASKDHVFAAHASGLADVEAEIPATLETVLPAASVSKLLTATLVMRQVEQGLLDLDAAANSYLPPERWIRDRSSQPVDATLRQLLTHTSGLPIAFMRGMAMPGDPILSLDEYLSDGLIATRPPGEKIVYANEGFALLGYLAAQVEGESFHDHVNRVLLKPLRMISSDFYPRADLDARLAASYGGLFQEGRGEHVDVTALAPAASLRTTLGDLIRFARMFLNNGELYDHRFLRAATIADMWRLQRANAPDVPEGFGLGFGVLQRPGRYRMWWDGGLPGAASRLAIFPEHGLALAVLSNRADPTVVNAISSRVITLMTGPVVDPLYLAKPEELDRAVGWYRLTDLMDPELWFLEPFAAFQVQRSGEGLSLDFQGAAFLRPLGSDRYRMEGGILDGLMVVFAEDHLIAGWLVADRIGAWQSPNALLSYLAVALLILVAGAGYGIYRLFRRARVSPSQE